MSILSQVSQLQRMKPPSRTHAPAVDGLEALQTAIAQLTAAMVEAPTRSREGAASALATLLKTKAELYPTDAEGLAEIAVQQGITPADFLQALKARWDKRESSDT